MDQMDKKRIVLADANEEFRLLFTQAVAAEEDMELVGDTSDGEQAAALARDGEADVVVMDLVLHSWDGLETLQAIRELPRRPRVLVLSSFARGEMAQLAAERGADYYMMKPCKLTAVLERVRQLADGVQEAYATAKTKVTATRKIIARASQLPTSLDEAIAWAENLARLDDTADLTVLEMQVGQLTASAAQVTADAAPVVGFVATKEGGE